MKFTVAKEHRDFFRKHFRIEFNTVLSSAQCEQMMAEQIVVLSERLHISKANLRTAPTSSQFMAGFDLWRGNAQLKKILLQKSLAEVAADLLDVRALRIGYDQFIPVPSLKSTAGKEDPYSSWLSQNSSLEEMSSIQGILAGLMICVKVPSSTSVDLSVDECRVEQQSELATPPSLFSKVLGNGVYFSPDVPLDFSELEQRRGYAYVLLAYAKAVSVYCKRDTDPHTNVIRQLGYNFGDRLSDRYHPLIVF